MSELHEKFVISAIILLTLGCSLEIVSFFGSQLLTAVATIFYFTVAIMFIRGIWKS